jgi:dihydrolipoamide dehydrogenase
LGGKIALLEPGQLGGTCVNRGCVPAKIWNKAAKIKMAISEASAFGINARIENIDLEAIINRRKGIPNDIQMGMNGLCKNNKIDVIKDKGILKSPVEIQTQGKVLETKKIIIATGTSPYIPEISGFEAASMTTEQVLEMTRVPSSILVNGGGPIEVEIAFILNAFGSKVYMIFETARILPGEDAMISQRLTKALREKGVEVFPRSKLKSIEKAGSGHKITISGTEEKSIEVESVLSSSRKPNTDIGLDQAGVKLDGKGFIAVDNRLKTSADNIYAIGDVRGGWQLSYAATCMGVIAAENAMGKESIYNSNLVPRGHWTIPEAASVGITEEEAEDQGIEVETGECPVSVNGVAMAYGETEGSVKVITDAKFGEILGMHIVSSNATELIWGASLAIQLEATADVLAYTLAVHPTFSETIPMAAQDASGWALYLPRRKK